MLKNIMFYSGSILHDTGPDGQERVAKGTHHSAVSDRLPEVPDEPNEPVRVERMEERAWQRLLDDYRTKKDTFDRAVLQQERLGANLYPEADRKDAAIAQEYERILKTYCYRDYLKCVHHYLGGFLGEHEWGYLMYKGKNVLAHGSTAFTLHPPLSSVIERSDFDTVVDRKLGHGQPVGKFARTATVVAPQKYGFLGITQDVRFIKKDGKEEYDVIGVSSDPEAVPIATPKGWSKVLAAGNETEMNKSSCVLRADMDQFVGRMLASNIGFPVFSVCDCNSFHTSGYIWATYAIRAAEAGADDPVAILNFDQHPDIGDASTNLVASDRWGAPALSTVRNGI